eukprot:TRINITY_DN49282_c0_g1_i1.p1 TRINITY_DN49282_c0_g1~~TRINITY_DN49282_c0_g1_i1.p1  ORF type:complete len:330 (+),score=18.58 TRINITY_DN49282_c0_g1_i1:66-1055(+)
MTARRSVQLFAVTVLFLTSSRLTFTPPTQPPQSSPRLCRAAGASGAVQGTDSFVLTYVGVNTFVLEAGGKRVLVDPLLVGDLVFAGQDWAYKARRRPASVKAAESIDPKRVAQDFDCVVLSQGLPDHAHPETLKVMDRTVHIIASPSAASVCKRLDFQRVTTLAPGESLHVGEAALKITATVGSVVGPPWQAPENGWIFTDTQTGFSLGTEPHGNFLGPRLGTSFRNLPASPPEARVDALLMPITKTDVAGYRLVNGVPEAIETLKTLDPVPRFIIPLKNTDIDATGSLAGALSEDGTLSELRAYLSRDPALQGVQLLDCQPGEPLSIA